MSRSIGDYPLKKSSRKLVIADPEVKHIPVSAGLSFVVLATDGLWDVVNPHDVRCRNDYTLLFMQSLHVDISFVLLMALWECDRYSRFCQSITSPRKLPLHWFKQL